MLNDSFVQLILLVERSQNNTVPIWKDFCISSRLKNRLSFCSLLLFNFPYFDLLLCHKM